MSISDSQILPDFASRFNAVSKKGILTVTNGPQIAAEIKLIFEKVQTTGENEQLRQLHDCLQSRRVTFYDPKALTLREKFLFYLLMPIRSLFYKYVNVTSLEDGRSFLVKQFRPGEPEISAQGKITDLTERIGARETQIKNQERLITEINEDINKAGALLKEAQKRISEQDRQIASLLAQTPEQQHRAPAVPSPVNDEAEELRQRLVAAEKKAAAQTKLFDQRLSLADGLFREEFHKRLKEALQTRWLGGTLKEGSPQDPNSSKIMVFEEATDPASGSPTVRYRYGKTTGYVRAEDTDELVRLAKDASSVYWVNPYQGN